jgi:hypothetical protein
MQTLKSGFFKVREQRIRTLQQLPNGKDLPSLSYHSYLIKASWMHFCRQGDAYGIFRGNSMEITGCGSVYHAVGTLKNKMSNSSIPVSNIPRRKDRL